jgi:hypothetical protein
MCCKLKKTDLNNILYIENMECYILISNTFSKPYGIYNSLELAEKEFKKLTAKFVNASLYKVCMDNNIIDKKDCYTLINDNNIGYW